MKIWRFVLVFFIFFNALVLAEEPNLDEFEEEYSSFEVNDPISGYNKIMTSFNIALYDYGINPLLRGYNFVTPQFFREGVRNFFDNLLSPLRFLGNVLQFKFEQAGDEFKRFLANTLLGFGGVRDVASIMGIEKHRADMGTVLAHWGVGGGFHIVLPVLGPSNLRDTLALPIDWLLQPTAYLDDFWFKVAISAYAIGNDLSFNLDELDEIYHNTPNVYPFIRDAYEQRRIELSK